jgi:hypothetical protein
MQAGSDRPAEDWKSELILKIARRKGFQAHELNDAHQQIQLEILNYKFDPRKAHGATERQIMSLLIEKKLTHIQRSEARRRKHIEKIRRVCGPSRFQSHSDEAHIKHENRFELRIDIEKALQDLAPLEQRVCEALSTGESRLQLSKRFKLSRHRINQIIDRIREQFINLGLDSN